MNSRSDGISLLAAQKLGFVWIGLGVLVLAVMYATGRRPKLSGMEPTQAPARPARERV
jgi:hypothetical protein